MEYTVIGDVVNTASRLQNLTKKAKVDILIDGSTRNKVRDKIKCRKVIVKGIRGKQQDIEVFTLDGLKSNELAANQSDELTYF